MQFEHKPVYTYPLEQQELCDGKAAEDVLADNCGRDLQMLLHLAAHKKQGSGNLENPLPPVMTLYGLVWIWTFKQTIGTQFKFRLRSSSL
jgi:hypothetical protein